MIKTQFTITHSWQVSMANMEIWSTTHSEALRAHGNYNAVELLFAEIHLEGTLTSSLYHSPYARLNQFIPISFGFPTPTSTALDQAQPKAPVGKRSKRNSGMNVVEVLSTWFRLSLLKTCMRGLAKRLCKHNRKIVGVRQARRLHNLNSFLLLS